MIPTIYHGKSRDSRLFDNLDLLTVEELAKVLHRAPKTIQNWVAKRQIPFLLLGRKVMFRRESIEAWLKEKEIKSWQ
ncbi:MAG: helix-turn-helix domain-containing protein [Proteobacteria bacterium]|nr:helix-turn-helix domain-containing protein [Pseudomonadota bacterium]